MSTYLAENNAELWLITPGFDDLLLTGPTVTADGYTFTIMAQAADADWGNAGPIDVAVERWMTDGAVAATQGHDNREPAFNLIVSADTAVDLAVGERELSLRSAANRRTNTQQLLKWVPPAGDPDAPASIFEVWTWHLNHAFDVDREMRTSRMYGLQATAKPWTRSEDLTVSEALPSGTTPTTIGIDTCTSTTGWTGTPNTPTTATGSVKETRANPVPHKTYTLSLTRTGAVSGMNTTPYVQLDTNISKSGTLQSMTVKADGARLQLVAQMGTVGYYTWPENLGGLSGPGPDSFTTLEITATIFANTSSSLVLSANDVSRTDTVGGIGSAKQLMRTLTVGGSVPTAGSIKIASPNTTDLGTVLLYTCPDPGTGYSPPLRQYRTSGTPVTPDTSCVSGNRDGMVTSGASAGTNVYRIPGGMLQEGQYNIIARTIFGTAAKLTFTIEAYVASFSTNITTITGKITATAAGPAWGVIGTLTLPNQMLPAESDLETVLLVSADADTGTHSLDELYLLDVTRGTVTLFAAGASRTRAWLDAPDADPIRNRPAIYVGDADDRSDAAAVPSSQVLSIGDHDLDPRGQIMLSVTDGVNNAEVSASYYQRWQTHAAA